MKHSCFHSDPTKTTGHADPTHANAKRSKHNTESLAEPTPTFLPVYIGLPKTGKRCPISSLSRSGLNDLILPSAKNGLRPPVASISLKANKHAKRGRRLVVVASLIAYLEGLRGKEAA